MKKTYNKTKWIDKRTPVNAQNLNKLEEAVKYLYDTALEEGFIKQGEGIKISEDGTISVDSPVMQSESLSGIEFITDEEEGTINGKLYFVIDSNTSKLLKIKLNGLTIFVA